jgi:hypothetical protein
MSTAPSAHRLALSAAAVLAAGAIAFLTFHESAVARAPDAKVAWTVLGPGNVGGWSGKVNAFAYVPSNPKVLYIGGGWGNTPRESPSQAGIFRSQDGGAHWTAIDNGLTDADGSISSVVNGLWLDPANPTVVLAATEFGGTFRSTDGGGRWRNVDRAESTQFSQAGSTLYVATRRGVLRSKDDGATWSPSLAVTAGATTVVTAGGVTYAGTTSGDVYRLNGSTWSLVGHPGAGATHNLAVDPFNTNVVYANVDDQRAWNQNLYASLNGGKSWRRIFCGCSVGAQAIAFSLVVRHRLYLGDDGGGFLFYLTADGNRHPQIHGGAQPYGADMRYVVVVPGKDSTDDACYILMDQGLFFAPRCSSGTAPGLSLSVPDALAYDVTVTPNGGRLVAALQDNGSGASSSGGSSWQYVNNTGEGGETFINPFNPSDCYIAHPDNGLYTSFDGCASFAGPSGVGIESLTFDPANASTLYAVTNADSHAAQVSVSTDAGKTLRATAWQFKDPYQVVVSPNAANTIVVASGTASTRPFLSASHDGGKTWHVASGLPRTRLWNAQTIYFPTHRFNAAFQPVAPGTVVLADHDPATDNVLIYRSVDGAQTFSLVATIVQPAPQRPWPNLLLPNPDERPAPEIPYYATRFYGNRLAFNPQAPKGAVPAAVLTTRFGAFASFDSGSHWQRIDGTAIPHHFIGAAWANGYVYLASFGGGVIRSSTPLQ